MRNAERYLAQGNIRSAIGEYKQIVEHDPRDFGTLNILGDMYTKNSQSKAAITCFTSVADHYNNQGFAQKAIAIYNKISKLEPDSVEISTKLAELYKARGSLKEARTHYTVVAEHYQSKGRKIDALAIWKEIALLDPQDTEVYLTLAESYVQENQLEEAADAFAEVGLRLANRGDHEGAISSFSKALEFKKDDPKVLFGFVKSKVAQGRAGEAVDKLNEILGRLPHSREIRLLLIDCHIETNDIANAEKDVIKLVEMEPANYPKFLELAQIYLTNDELGSCTRVLSMSSEHMLAGGQADEFHALLNEILSKNPEQLDALRLLSRYCSWQRDEEAFRKSLVRLAGVAKDADSVDDERYALLQLTMIAPHDTASRERLRDINELHGFVQSDDAEDLFDKRFLKNRSSDKSLQYGELEVIPGEVDGSQAGTDFNGSEEYRADLAIVDGFVESESGFEITDQSFQAEPEAPDTINIDSAVVDEELTLDPSDEVRLQKEIDTIKFYIESGYTELAEKAVNEMRDEFGNRSEFKALTAILTILSADPVEVENDLNSSNVTPNKQSLNGAKPFDLDDFRSDLGLEEVALIDDSAYDTHFQTAVAYQEMALFEDAIKEFQEAVSLVAPNDGTRRFFSCANLLGHCFMQKSMPSLALTWFQRALETADLNDDEKQGLWYELAGAYEAEGDTENAGRYFEQVYAENVNFRDVSERMKSIAVNH